MKKKIKLGLIVIFSLLIGISSYAYISSKNLFEYVEESMVLRKKILILGDIRTDIVKSSQSQQLYMLTNKDDYKNEFNENSKEIYTLINDMYDENYISSSEKRKLIFTIDKYKNSSSSYFNKTYNSTITPDLENQIIQYNNEQLDILKEITLDLSSESEAFSKKDNTISTLYSTQAKLIQGASSFITIIISSFILYFKKKLNKENVDIEDIFSYLTNSNEINNNLDKKDSEDLQSYKQKISETEVLLSNAKLLYIQSLKVKEQYDKSEIILAQIDISIKSFKLKLNNLNDYPSLAQNLILEDLENQLINLKILFKSLPYYNEFIIDISKNMIYKDNNNDV